jgi:hypothetical protein
MNSQTFYGLMQDWKGTPMEEVMNILSSENFIDSNLPVRKDKIIRELSSLEKAFFTQLVIFDEQVETKLNNLGYLEISCFNCPAYGNKNCPIYPEYEKAQNIEHEWSQNTTALRAIFSELSSKQLDTCNCYIAKGFLFVSEKKSFKSNYKSQKSENNKNKSLQLLLEESIAGTFLETIVEIMETESFEDSTLPIQETDTFVTELKEFEKAIFTMIVKLDSEFETLSKEIKALSVVGPLEDTDEVEYVALDIQDPEYEAKLKTCEELSEKMDEIIIVIQNFGDILCGIQEEPIIDTKNNNAQIRAGFKLVIT